MFSWHPNFIRSRGLSRDISRVAHNGLNTHGYHKEKKKKCTKEGWEECHSRFHWIYLCFFSLFAIRLWAIVGFWLYTFSTPLIISYSSGVGMQVWKIPLTTLKCIYIPLINIQYINYFILRSTIFVICWSKFVMCSTL